jgi:surface protein
MNSMFIDASVFNSDLSNWNVSSVTNMGSMFALASSFNSDLSSWNVSNVNTMQGMFLGAELFNSDLSNWDVSNVTNMQAMFPSLQYFNSDLSSWDVSSVKDMSDMFLRASSFNSDLSNWDVSSVTRMRDMFGEAILFNSDLSSWDVSSVTDLSDMFNESGLSTENYDAILIGWSQIGVQLFVKLGAEGINYCLGEDARQSLIDDHGWTINDAGLDCSTVGVEDETKLNVSVYPNPTSNILNVEGNSNELKATVFDVLGKEVMNQFITDKINLHTLQKGIYFIKLSDGLRVSLYKIIKNNQK